MTEKLVAVDLTHTLENRAKRLRYFIRDNMKEQTRKEILALQTILFQIWHFTEEN